MKVTRRDLLVWSAGAAAGLLVTPMPWKILDDTAIWSQNWPWIPQPAHGPVETRHSFCTLCPSGCGLRVRMTAGWPVGIAGMKTHPVTGGALCPLAFGAHQLNWHPQRLRNVQHHGQKSSWRDAQVAFAKACSEGPLTVIDGYAGRAASVVLKEFAGKQHGSYRVITTPEARALAPYESWGGVPASHLGYDLENAKTILSFGAPLLDGWGAPGRFTRLWAERAAGMSEPELRLIQIEPSLSRTAARAWKWITVREGSESALASGLARVLLEQKLVPAHGPIPSVTISEVAAQTGLTADAICDLAPNIVARRPVLAIAREYDPAIAALNVVLGAVGARGGIVLRSHSSESSPSGDADRSKMRAVLIDASVPWKFAPQTEAEIFRFAAWDGGSTTADWLLPAPGFLEELTDIPTAPTSAIETYAVAPALAKPTSDVRSAAQFLTTLDTSLTSVERVIHGRCAELFRAHAGTLYSQEPVPVEMIENVEKLHAQLWTGAVWAGEQLPVTGLRCELNTWPADEPASCPVNWTSNWQPPVLAPLASKLYLESNLRDGAPRRIA